MKNIVLKYTKETLVEKKGIYLIKILSKPNYFYVGSTKCKEGFYRRWYQHLYQLKKNKHSSPFLQNIVNKYGIDCIEFQIIEIVEDFNILYEREQYWLDFYYENHKVLNFAPIVAANSLAMTENVKNKISKSLKGKYILGDSSNAKQIFVYDCFGNYIENHTSILESCIKYDLKNNNFYKLDRPLYMKGLLFSRFELTLKEKEYFNRYGACKKYWCRKPIYQKDLKNNLIKEWSCAEEAAKYLKISSGALNQALKGKVKICKNSLWSYSNYKHPWN